MHETAARDLLAVRAIETSDRDRLLWSDADRAWASRAAAELVTGAGGEQSFLVRRAALAREQLVGRFPALRRTLQAFAWPGWVAPAMVAIAFVVGISIDRIGDQGRINILAPPVLGLLAWNVAVYAVLVHHAWRHRLERRGDAPGPFRGMVARLAGASMSFRKTAPDIPLGQALAAFAADWSRVAALLYAARATRILHLAAAALAAGVIAGFYVRGLAFEYRASWQSTFLDAAQVHQLLRIVLMPGAWLTGLAIPGTEHIAALRSSTGGGGENAAGWLHLYAATVGLVVIVPRLLLAASAWMVERRRQANMPVTLADPYFRRLVRNFVEGPLRIRIVPYSFSLTPAAIDALQASLSRAFGRCETSVADSVPYGAEDGLGPHIAPGQVDVILGVFNATATPEGEAHGAFLARLRAIAPAAQCIAIVDESAFRQRWPLDDARLAQRRKAWQELFASVRLAGVFVHLAQPDLETAAQALEIAIERAAQ